MRPHRTAQHRTPRPDGPRALTVRIADPVTTHRQRTPVLSRRLDRAASVVAAPRDGSTLGPVPGRGRVRGHPPGKAVSEPVVVVAAGEQVTVWPDGDLPYLHAIVCLGAGLETTVRRMSAEQRQRVRAELRARAPQVKIADVRRPR